MTEELLLLEIEQEQRKRKSEKDKLEYERDTTRRESWQKTIQSGIDSLWNYCHLKEPSYYTDDKIYLKNLVNTLQAFYEGRIIKYDASDDWQIVATTEGLENIIVCKKIMINIPPRFGKSRSLINFCQWIFGKNQTERIIECSYNDDAAGDFAKFTRDGIQEQRISESGFVFSDFFPKVKIKHGSSSYYKWALEGQFFNYLGAGIGGSITGKGGSILIIDDPIKLAEEAFNQERLEKIWTWYTGTFLSRGDAEGREPFEIIVMTRWAENDLCGRILNSDEAPEWYIFKLEAYNKQTDLMLCEKVLSRERYFSLSKKMVHEIFRANYHQEPIDLQGKLYQSFKTYIDTPKDENGKSLFEGLKNYTDTADEGDDYLCSICYGVYKGSAYILDVLYTQAPMEETEPATAKMLFDNKVREAQIESNNGGRGFARNVERLLWENHKTKSCFIKWFHQSQNKMARIFTNSSTVQNNVFFPINWKDKWPDYYNAMVSYQKGKKNLHDDAPDATTGVAESISIKRQLKAVNH
ncbi:MAG: phage terminase large subunit [Bacteroidota bacterium]